MCFWPPAVIGIGHKVVVVPKGNAQPAVLIREPVLATGMVDEDEFDRL
jgi:hypothetical protein